MNKIKKNIVWFFNINVSLGWVFVAFNLGYLLATTISFFEKG